MRALRRILIGLFLVLALPLALVAWYFMPRTIDVYIVDTQNKLVGTAKQVAAKDRGDLDLMMIQTVDPADNRKPHVFRNEDAWWFAKFNSYDLQTIAADAARSNPPRLMRVKYYGWRIPLLSVLPNAISMKPVTSD